MSCLSSIVMLQFNPFMIFWRQDVTLRFFLCLSAPSPVKERYIVQVHIDAYIAEKKRWKKIDKDWLVILWNRSLHLVKSEWSKKGSENECVLQISSLSTCSQQSTIFHLIPHYSFQFLDCIFLYHICFASRWARHSIAMEFSVFFLFRSRFSKRQDCMLFYIHSAFITIIFTLISIDFHENGIDNKKW